MTDETSDDGQRHQASPFVFPEDPQSAQITFTITVEDPPSRERGEEVPGEGLLMSAVLEPGGGLLDPAAVRSFFDEARIEPVAGEYVLEASNCGELLIKSPAAVSQDDGRALVLQVLPHLMGWRGQLVSALESFPGAQTIDMIARDVVGMITIASLNRLAFTDEPVADARAVEVRGVQCVSCGFGLAFMLQKLSEMLGVESPSQESVRELEGVRFLVERKDKPVVKIGYLIHENSFAPCLNAELAARVREAIAQVADEVVLEIAAKNEVQRRLCASSGLSLHRTYALDAEAIARRALELETEIREAFAGSAAEEPRHDDGSETDEHGDNYRDELDFS